MSTKKDIRGTEKEITYKKVDEINLNINFHPADTISLRIYADRRVIIKTTRTGGLVGDKGNYAVKLSKDEKDVINKAKALRYEIKNITEGRGAYFGELKAVSK